MARLVPRDGYVKETNIKSQSGVRRYKADKSGLYEVSNANDIRALKDQGFVEAIQEMDNEAIIVLSAVSAPGLRNVHAAVTLSSPSLRQMGN